MNTSATAIPLATPKVPIPNKIETLVPTIGCTLRPTVISMYNYVQPIVGTSVSILLGMGTFGIAKGIAVALVFTGVYIVTQSKSREQMLAEQAAKKE